jgi:heptosyltransferase-2
LRAVVIHPGFLGDAVFLGPAVRSLKSRDPEGKVAVCTTPRGAPAARLLPGCDEVIVFDKRGSDRGLFGLLRTGRALRRFEPDLAIVSHYSLRSGALAWLSGAPRRIGYPPFFCTERVALDRDQPFVERAMALVARAGGGAVDQDRALRLLAPTDLDQYAERMLSGATGAGAVVGIVPGAEWPTKRWGAEKYALLAVGLHERGATILILGGPGDRLLADRIQELSNVPMRDTTGNSIAEAIALLARCDLVLGGDSGLVHCARALGCKVLVLFGPTDPGKHLFSPGQQPLELRLTCQPCHRHGPELCPLGHHHCMTLLSPRAVMDAASAMLDAPSP